MATLVWTDEAQRWLEDIHEYIAADNAKAAAQTIQRIYAGAQTLLDHPDIGYQYAGSSRPVRILLVEHFRIAYLIRPNGDIHILGVFHGALDIGRYTL